MTRRVVVVGGGFAGCMAARDLHNDGVDVVLLEARHRVGGRVLSHRFEDGVVAELGAELIEDWYTLMLGIASRHELTFVDGPERVRRFPFFDKGHRLDTPNEQIVAGVTRALLRLQGMINGAAANPRGPAALEIDAMTVEQGLDSIELDGVPRRWFEALISGWSCLEPDEESLLHFALKRALPQLASGFGAARRGRRLVGGNDQVARILVEPLADRVVHGATVRAIDWSRGRVTVRYETAAGMTSIEAEACVVAVPPQPLFRIFISPKLPPHVGAYEAVLGGCGAKIVFRHRAGLATDPVFLSREPRFHGWQSGDRTPGTSTTLYFGGTYARRVTSSPDPRGRQQAVEWLSAAYPDARDAIDDVVVAAWCTDPLTVTCGPVFPPGLMTTAVSPSPAPVDDVLFFAGEHTSPDRFGSMEGALETGRRAATEVLRVLA